MADTCALEGIDIPKSFGGFSALKDVGIRVPAGEIRGVIGPGEDGKSTLMDVLSGRARHWTGNVRMFGRDISASSVQQRRRAGLARSFQRTNIFPHLTVVDQLKIAARAARLPNVDEIMAELTLTALAYKRAADTPQAISAVSISHSLSSAGPKILLLDEPAAGLSIEESLDLAHTLKDLAARWGVTVLLVEHDMDVRVLYLRSHHRSASRHSSRRRLGRRNAGCSRLLSRRISEARHERVARISVASNPAMETRGSCTRSTCRSAKVSAWRSLVGDARRKDYNRQHVPRRRSPDRRRGAPGGPAPAHNSEFHRGAAWHRRRAPGPTHDVPDVDGPLESHARRRRWPDGTVDDGTGVRCFFRSWASGPIPRERRFRAASNKCSRSAAR